MAGFDAYLQIEGIPGEALDDKHKDWIELLSYSHQMDQPTSATRSSAGGAAAGRTVHHDFHVTKYIDKASPKIYEAVSKGTHIKKVKLEVCRAGGSQVKFLEVTMEEVLISSVAPASHGGKEDLPTESVSFNYGKIEWVYTQQKRADGSGGGNVAGKHDLTANK